MCKSRHPGYPYSRKTDGNLRNVGSETEYILHNVLINAQQSPHVPQRRSVQVLLARIKLKEVLL